MASFKKTNAKYFSKPQQKLTADNEYWNKLGDPVVLKEFAGIDHVSFSKVDPYYFAITSSAKVQVYNPITKLVYKTLSKFREAAYGGTFRKDGKLLVAGGEDPEIKLFDVSSKNLLRVFKGHKGPIHRCFFTCDNTHISSFSDDKVVALWDIPSESRVASFSYGKLIDNKIYCLFPVSLEWQVSQTIRTMFAPAQYPLFHPISLYRVVTIKQSPCTIQGHRIQ
uniref:U3 small nucleolar RNA-associated protein 15 homolog n=1 Tax=Cacopsylla melanoneura TaxID=428564 RepID=A0A8D8MI81_9HEMI